MPQVEQNRLRESSCRPNQHLILVGLVALALCLMGCGKGSGGGIHVKSAGTGEKDVPQKSAFAFAVTKSFTDINGKISTASSYRVYLANYDLDAPDDRRTV